LKPFHLAAGQGATDEQRIEVTEVVGVKVTQKDLVEVVVRDLKRRDALGRSGPDVEDELVAVAQLEQPTRRGLLRTRGGHAGAACDQPHFVQQGWACSLDSCHENGSLLGVERS
jgi:hypothetical protein